MGKYTVRDFINSKLLDKTDIMNLLEGRQTSLKDYVYYSLFPAAWKGYLDVYMRLGGSGTNTWEKYSNEFYKKIEGNDSIFGYVCYKSESINSLVTVKMPHMMYGTAYYSELTKSSSGQFVVDNEINSFFMKTSDVLSSVLIDYVNGKTLTSDDKAKCDALWAALKGQNQASAFWTQRKPQYVFYSTNKRSLRPKSIYSKLNISIDNYAHWLKTSYRVTTSRMSNNATDYLNKIRKENGFISGVY